MGGNQSKIPIPVPGHLLKFTGIEEFDRVYKSLEISVKRIQEIEIDLNMHTTDFIRALGARELWESKPSVQKLIQVLLVVLSAEGNGALADLVDYSSDFPYLILRETGLKKRSRKLAKYFGRMMESLNVLPKSSLKYVAKLKAKLSIIEQFQNEIAGKTIEAQYNMPDKLAAIHITANNFHLCENAIKVSKEMKKICEEVITAVEQAVIKAQTPPHCEILASRGLQASSEGLVNSKEIVQKFWPMV